ncbi:hypothetical protein [Pseudomonas taiwanensis]|uniref:hypothetical protein n=1 Tax=Pseudomonas taiwanensis TaxID=470150 RepID=UPI001644575F|nr:hypothetical protein [Pseudomonas taiwanensis]MBC3489875.1 hypothetical protein [Pseudomonas taiwanensis]
MSEVHRYKAVQLISVGGGHIGYDPHGPDVVMAAEYDELRAKLAERDALLRKLADDVLFVAPSYRQKAEALLSASAEPSAPASFIACHVDESCGQSAPVERDERAGFEAYCAAIGLPIDRLPSGEYLIPAARFAYQGWHSRAALERTEHHG